MPDPPPRRMSREARREMLLDAAAHMLAGDNTSLSFESIADEAGVSATLPYKYFESTDEIAAQLYQRVVATVDASTMELLVSGAPFDDKVTGTFLLWAEMISAHGNLHQALAGTNEPKLRRSIETRREEFVHIWATEIEREFGVEHDAALLLAASTTAASSALLTRWVRDRRRRHDTAEAFRQIVRSQCEAFVSKDSNRTFNSSSKIEGSA